MLDEDDDGDVWYIERSVGTCSPFVSGQRHFPDCFLNRAVSTSLLPPSPKLLN
jgi:hypothetical protein